MLGSNAVHAQLAEGEVTEQPICFVLKNTAPYTVITEIATNYFQTADGQRDNYTSVMHIRAAGSVNEEGNPIDEREICTSGPFYEGRKIRLVIKTLFPIFECKTAIDRGEVIIKGHRKEEGGTETYAECY